MPYNNIKIAWIKYRVIAKYLSLLAKNDYAIDILSFRGYLRNLFWAVVTFITFSFGIFADFS